jgi:hypothetical protein
MKGRKTYLIMVPTGTDPTDPGCDDEKTYRYGVSI